MKTVILDQHFKGQDFSVNRLPKAEYENCLFEGCNFSKGYLDNQIFLECRFIDCNLSNTNIVNTTFNEVCFSHSKLIGLAFATCNAFPMDLSFTDCNLSFADFHGLKLKKQLFDTCTLNDVDFSNSDLSEAKFDHCELERAIFSSTNLVKADFSTALNFNIDPEYNTLTGAIFSTDGLAGLLNKYKLKIRS